MMTSNGTEQNSKYYAIFSEPNKECTLSKEIYIPCKKLKFEKNNYNVPGKIEQYLIAQYGEDYMQLPPEEKRHTHEPIQIKF